MCRRRAMQPDHQPWAARLQAQQLQALVAVGAQRPHDNCCPSSIRSPGRSQVAIQPPVGSLPSAVESHQLAGEKANQHAVVGDRGDKGWSRLVVTSELVVDAMIGAAVAVVGRLVEVGLAIDEQGIAICVGSVVSFTNRRSVAGLGPPIGLERWWPQWCAPSRSRGLQEIDSCILNARRDAVTLGHQFRLCEMEEDSSR
jgi:hypothetical protein